MTREKSQGYSARKNSVMQGYVATYHAMVAAAFLSTGIHGLLKFPKSTYMNEMGVSLALYGILISVGYIIQLVINGLVGNASDKSGEKRMFLIASVGLDFLMHVVFLVSTNIIFLSIAFVIQSACAGIFRSVNYAVISSITLKGKEGRNFAVYNIGGSLGWMVFSLVNGIMLTLLGYRALFLCAVVLCGIELLIIVKYIRNSGMQTYTDMKEKSVNLFKGVDKNVLLRIIGVYVLYFLTNLNHIGGFTYLQLYFNAELTLSVMTASIVMAASGFFEIPFALVTGRLMSRLKSTTVIITGCMIGAARWFVLTLAQGPGLLIVVQLMHACVVCIITVAMTTYLSKIIPQHLKGTAYGLFNSMGAAGCIFGPMLVGILSDSLGIKTAMRINVLFGVLGIILFVTMNMISSATQAHRSQKKA